MYLKMFTVFAIDIMLYNFNIFLLLFSLGIVTKKEQLWESSLCMKNDSDFGR